jgi:hypothetical protein
MKSSTLRNTTSKSLFLPEFWRREAAEHISKGKGLPTHLGSSSVNREAIGIGHRTERRREMGRSVAWHDNQPSPIIGHLRCYARRTNREPCQADVTRMRRNLLTGAGGQFTPVAEIVNDTLDLWFIPDIWAGEDPIPIPYRAVSKHWIAAK